MKQFIQIKLILIIILFLNQNITAISNKKIEQIIGPGSYEITSENEKIIIPFDIFKGEIRMKATINGRPCNLLIDNGSLWDEILFFGSKNVDSLNLEITEETAFGDSISQISADVSSNFSVKFNDVTFNNQKAIITHYNPNLPNLWEGVDGQVSATFFKHFITKINFDELYIELIPPKKFKYKGKGTVLKMKEGPHNTRLVNTDITLKNSKTISLDLIVDLGGIHPIYLPLGSNDGIQLPENAVESVLGVFGRKNTGYIGRVDEIKLGKYKLDNVITAFKEVNENANEYGNTMIGMPLLNKFNLIFDYFSNRLILEPSRKFKEPYLANMTGLNLKSTMDYNLQVTEIYRNGPTSVNNIKIDDIITHINYNPASELMPQEIKEILQKENSTVTFTILRNGESHDINIRLKQIF